MPSANTLLWDASRVGTGIWGHPALESLAAVVPCSCWLWRASGLTVLGLFSPLHLFLILHWRPCLELSPNVLRSHPEPKASWLFVSALRDTHVSSGARGCLMVREPLSPRPSTSSDQGPDLPELCLGSLLRRRIAYLLSHSDRLSLTDPKPHRPSRSRRHDSSPPSATPRVSSFAKRRINVRKTWLWEEGFLLGKRLWVRRRYWLAGIVVEVCLPLDPPGSQELS